MKIRVQHQNVQSAKDIEAAFRSFGKMSVHAVLVLETPLINSQRVTIANLALQNQVPVIYRGREYVEDGGLMSYGVNTAELDRRAAVYVDKS